MLSCPTKPITTRPTHHHHVFSQSKLGGLNRKDLTYRDGVRIGLGINPYPNECPESDDDSEEEEDFEEEEEEFSEDEDEEEGDTLGSSDDYEEGDDDEEYEKSFVTSDHDSSSASEILTSSSSSENDDDDDGDLEEDEDEDSSFFLKSLKLVDGINYELASSDEEGNAVGSSTKNTPITFVPSTETVLPHLADLIYLNCTSEEDESLNVSEIARAASSKLALPTSPTSSTTFTNMKDVYVEAFYYYLRLRRLVERKLTVYSDRYARFQHFLEKLAIANYANFFNDNEASDRCFCCPQRTNSRVTLYVQSSNSQETFFFEPKYTSMIASVSWLWLFCRMINDEAIRILKNEPNATRAAKKFNTIQQTIISGITKLCLNLQIISSPSQNLNSILVK
jgi:hypothetical protein